MLGDVGDRQAEYGPDVQGELGEILEISVTRPVSWGRGDTSLHQTWLPFTKSSTPKMPRPPSSPVTAAAMRRLSASAFGLMGWGCQDSR